MQLVKFVAENLVCIRKGDTRNESMESNSRAGAGRNGAISVWATSYSPCTQGYDHCSWSTSSGARLTKGIIAVRYSWYLLFAGERVYVPGYGFAVIGDVGGGLPDRYWIDLGFEWVARELVTVTTTWPALNIAVTVDGVPVSRSQWEVKGPDAIALPSAQGPRYGYVVADALYLPALPPGDHVVTWTVTFARNVDDGWALHPRGSQLVVTSTLHIGKDDLARFS